MKAVTAFLDWRMNTMAAARPTSSRIHSQISGQLKLPAELTRRAQAGILMTLGSSQIVRVIGGSLGLPNILCGTEQGLPTDGDQQVREESNGSSINSQLARQ